MLKIVKNPEFTAKVKVTVPVNGGSSDASFTGRFRALTVTEAEGFNLATTAGTTEYLRDIFIGWGEDVAEEDGTPLSFNDETRDQLIDIPYVRMGLLATYNAAMSGAKRGN